jgi:hypothetical protein
MRIRLFAAVASLALWMADAAPQRPSKEEQERLLESARAAALNYTNTLPDFICNEFIRRFSDATGKGKEWSAVDDLTVRVSFFDRKEHYKLAQINRLPTSESYDSVGGAITQGEFGTLLRRAFDPSVAAAYSWRSWANLRSLRLWVYAYRVTRASSTWSLEFRNGDKSSETITGYSGLLYIDPATSAVFRLTVEAEGIPKDFPISLASTSLDYGYADIAGLSYLLPLSAETRMRGEGVMTRNVVDFESYRKFTVDSTVDYPQEGEPDRHLDR